MGQDPLPLPECTKIQEAIMEKYAHTDFRDRLDGPPPVRGPLGEAKIEIKPGRPSVKQRPFQLTGERREALIKIIDGLVSEGKLEKGYSAWNSPAFPVPKKNPGEWR